MVASVDLERARSALERIVDEQAAAAPPGDAPRELIERDLADAVDDDEHDEVDAELDPADAAGGDKVETELVPSPYVERMDRAGKVFFLACVLIPVLVVLVAALRHWPL